MAKLRHDQLAEKDVAKPIIDQFITLEKQAEAATAAIKKTKSALQETKTITSSKDVDKLSEATKKLNEQEKILIGVKKKLDALTKKASKTVTDEEKAI